jgi:hypothetical protein
MNNSMRINWRIIIYCIVLLLPLVIVTGINWKTVSINIFNYTLTDLYTVIIGIVIGLGISTYYSTKFGNYHKKAEILSDNIDSVIEIYTDINKNFSGSESKILTVEEKKRYLKLLRDISNELKNIESYANCCLPNNRSILIKMKNIQYLSFQLKTYITDKPFASNYTILRNDVYLASDKFYEIKKYFQETKMTIYS